MARNQLAKISSVESTVGELNGVVRFTFADEVVVNTDLKELFGTPKDYTDLPYIAQCLLVHGYRQKGPDAYAGAKNPAEAREKLQGVKVMLWGSEGAPAAWSAKREGGTREGSIEKLARAAMVAFAAQKPPVEKNYDTVLANLQKKTVQERNLYRKIPDVRKALSDIESDASKSMADMDV